MKLVFRGFLVVLAVWLVGSYFVPKRMQDGPLGYAMALHPANILSHSAIDCAYRQGELDGIMYLFKGGSARLERANDCMRIARLMPSPMYRTQRRLDWEWLNYFSFSGKGAQAAEGWVDIARSDAFTFSLGMEGDGAAAWRRAVWAAGRSEDNIRVIELAREALSILASDAYAERFVAAVEGLDYFPLIGGDDEGTFRTVLGVEVPTWASDRLFIAEMMAEALVAEGRPEEAERALDALYAEEPFASGEFDLEEHRALMNSLLGEALDDRERLEAALTYWQPVVELDLKTVTSPEDFVPFGNLRAFTHTLHHLGQLGQCDEAREIIDTLPVGEGLPGQFERPDGRDLAQHLNRYNFQCHIASLSANGPVAEQACGLFAQLEESTTVEESRRYNVWILEEPLPRPEPSACFLSD